MKLKQITIAATVGLTLALTSVGASASSHKPHKGVIGVSYPTIEGPWFTAVLYGMTDQAKAHGYDLVILSAGGYANVQKQVGQMADLIQRQVDGILTAVADPNALAPQIQAARDAGIPVVAAGELGQNVNSSVTASHCGLGREMAEGAKRLLPNGGKLAGLKGPAGAYWTEERWKCFADTLKGSNIKIVATRSSEPSVLEGLRIAEDLLQRFPDIDAFYAVDDTVGVGAAQAVQQGPGCDRVHVVTAILGPEAARLLKEGCIDHLVAQQTVKIGRIAVDTVVRLIKRETVDDVVEVPNLVVMPDNIDGLDVSNIRQPKGWRP